VCFVQLALELSGTGAEPDKPGKLVQRIRVVAQLLHRDLGAVRCSTRPAVLLTPGELRECFRGQHVVLRGYGDGKPEVCDATGKAGGVLVIVASEQVQCGAIRIFVFGQARQQFQDFSRCAPSGREVRGADASEFIQRSNFLLVHFRFLSLFACSQRGPYPVLETWSKSSMNVSELRRLHASLITRVSVREFLHKAEGKHRKGPG
jgi:hypothetical protein